MPSLQVELEFSSIGPINPATIMLLLQLNTALSKISEVLPLLDEHCGESTLLKSILGALQASASGWRAESNAGDRMDTDSTPDSEAESREDAHRGGGGRRDGAGHNFCPTVAAIGLSVRRGAIHFGTVNNLLCGHFAL